MRYGCIGEVLKHSFSAEIHALLSSETYALCEIPKDELDAWMQRKNFLGINVTIPYKQAVIPHLFEIDQQAKEIGAVNTIVNRNGKLYGYNTDFYGMQTLLSYLEADLRQKKVAILGTGGTSLTALAVCRAAGAAQILRVSRSEHEDTVTYRELSEQHTDIQILINTTPCGMYPHPHEMPIDIDVFPKLECVADAIYNPLRPRLILEARKRGIAAEGGLLMLVAQAVRAAEIFHDVQYPQGTVEQIWRQMVRQKENLVLIGMPGCGKTTVGKLLAERLGREFCDMDDALTLQCGMTPAEMIRQKGDACFRDAETSLLKENLSMKNGLVIATGGGAILRPENEEMLRQNGRICFLDRPWQKLIPTNDRPLSGTRELLKQRYEERYARYTAAADIRVDDPQTPQLAAGWIEREWKNL